MVMETNAHCKPKRDVKVINLKNINLNLQKKPPTIKKNLTGDLVAIAHVPTVASQAIIDI